MNKVNNHSNDSLVLESTLFVLRWDNLLICQGCNWSCSLFCSNCFFYKLSKELALSKKKTMFGIF